jgi:hypothetical protein
MKFKITKEWLQKSTDKEDELPVAAGAIAFELVDETAEKQPVVAEESCAYSNESVSILSQKIEDFGKFNEFLSSYRHLVDTGKLAQFYCEKLFDLTQHRVLNGPYDLEDKKSKDEKRIEVKYRFSKGGFPPGMVLDFQKFDIVYYVELRDDLLPAHIHKIKKADITQLGGEQWSDSYKGRVSFKEAYNTGKAKIVFPSSAID